MKERKYGCDLKGIPLLRVWVIMAKDLTNILLKKTEKDYENYFKF